MAKYKKNSVSDKTVEESMVIAKGIKKPNQTKEQTKLIAQGIQKGIDQYKKQQKSKARERDKLQKKVAKSKLLEEAEVEQKTVQAPPKLPWLLLGVSWVFFLAYLYLTR